MKAWLQLLRISNLPTVWSNVLLGVVAGLEAWRYARGTQPGATLVFLSPEGLPGQLGVALPLMLAMSCLYLAGMALNDVLDVEHDRVDAPHRPIVAGRVSRRAAGWATAALFALGLALLALYGRAPLLAGSVALAACIVLYDLWHHRWPISRHLMGVCRGLIVVTASLVIAPITNAAWLWFVGAPALLLVVYTNVLTWVAARESDPAHGPARRRLVLRMIAAMPLLDAAVLLTLHQWPAAAFCAGCAVLTSVWHGYVSGT